MKHNWMIRIIIFFGFLLSYAACLSQSAYLYRNRKVETFEGFNVENNSKVSVTADEHFMVFHSFNGTLIYDLIDRYPFRQLSIQTDLLSMGNVKPWCLLRVSSDDETALVVIYDIVTNRYIDTLDKFDVADKSKYNNYYVFDGSDQSIILHSKTNILQYNISLKNWYTLNLDPPNTEIAGPCGKNYLLYILKDSLTASTLWAYDLLSRTSGKMSYSENGFVLPANISTQQPRFIFYDSIGRSYLISIDGKLSEPRFKMDRFPFAILALNKAGSFLQYRFKDHLKQEQFVVYDLERDSAMDTLTTRLRLFPFSPVAYDPLYLRDKSGFQLYSFKDKTAEVFYAQHARINAFKVVNGNIMLSCADSLVRIISIDKDSVGLVNIGFVANRLVLSRDSGFIFAYNARSPAITRINAHSHQTRKIDLREAMKNIGNAFKMYELQALDSCQLLLIQNDRLYKFDILQNKIVDSILLMSDASYGNSLPLNDSLIAIGFKTYYDPFKKDDPSMEAMAIVNFKNGATEHFFTIEQIIKQMPSGWKRPRFIEIVGVKGSNFYTLLENNCLFTTNLLTGKTNFIDSVTNIPDSLFNLYTQQKIFLTGPSYLELTKHQIDSLPINNLKEGFFWNDGYFFLDEQNANLNIATFGKYPRLAQLNFYNRTNDYFIKTDQGEFDGTLNRMNQIFFNINSGERFTNAEEYFADLYEPFLLKKLTEGFEFPTKPTIFKYMSSPIITAGLLSRRIGLTRASGKTTLCFHDDEIFNEIIFHSHFDTIVAVKNARACARSIIIEDSSVIVEQKESSPKAAIANHSDPTGITILGAAIDEYPPSSGLPRLTACKASVAQFMSFFDPKRVPFVKSVFLKDERATKASIVANIDHLNGEKDKTETIILYLVGHGLKSDYGSTFYFFSYDANLAKKRSTALSSIELSTLLRELKFKTIILAIDACYSASLIQSIEKVAAYKALKEGVTIALLLSSNQDVKSYQNGSMTEYLSKLLLSFSTCPNNGSGVISIADLKAYMGSQKDKKFLNSMLLLSWGQDQPFYNKR